MAKNKKRIVILGAGFGGVYTIMHLNKLLKKHPDAECVLINRENYFIFTPLLHEVATGGIAPQNIIEPIRKVLGKALADFYKGEVLSVDLKKQIVKTKLREFSYDYLVLALGAQTNYFDTPGAEENCYTLKHLDDAIELKNRFIAAIEQASHIEDKAERKKLLRFAVIGGGPTGVELAAELQDFYCHTFCKYYKASLIDEIEIVLINRSESLLGGFSPKFGAKAEKVLRKNGIKVMLGVGVIEVEKDKIKLDNGEMIETLTPIWVAGVKPSTCEFIGDTLKENRGKIIVNEYLQTESHKNVFVLGDLACFFNKGEDRPLPGLAQVATGQGKAVAINIVAAIEGKPMQSFFYKSKGTLLSLGKWMAIAEIGKHNFSGHLTWLMWRSIYLMKLISLPKQLKVIGDWVIHLFAARDISEINYSKK